MFVLLSAEAGTMFGRLVNAMSGHRKTPLGGKRCNIPIRPTGVGGGGCKMIPLTFFPSPIIINNAGGGGGG